MPNQSSKAGHIPIRTCVVCRRKAEQKSLLSFYLLGGEPVFDLRNSVPVRKQYICFEDGCITQLDKWLSRHRKKAAAAERGK